MAVDIEGLRKIIDEELSPIVRKVDTDAVYADQYIYALGKAGFFSSHNKEKASYLIDELTVVNETAKVCMTTAFCIWCHLASLTYLRQCDNDYLKQNVLPQLENGDMLGATGLSNPMKFYAGLEKLHLQAERVEGGYIINGVLPAVSNLGDNHWFGALASVTDDEEVMVLVSSKAEGLVMKEKTKFVGVNGSATYTCRFTNVFIPEAQIIAENARTFVDQIRPTFILYQIPLGLGVTAAAADGIEKVKSKQNGCNAYLTVQAEQLRTRNAEIEEKLQAIVQQDPLHLSDIVNVRLEAVYHTLEAVQANMLHNGAAGYVDGSVPYRKLREAYFFANLTPTVRQLEKMTAQ
jgi:alkylation response protein AidB-like acyl-CoA dehydrogenase